MFSNSRLIGFMRAWLCPGAAAFILVCALAGAHSIYGQSMPGFQAPTKPKAQDNTTVSLKAARGQAPLSKLYGHLRIDSGKVRSLPPLDPSERKRAVSEKPLRIGVVRPLPMALDPLADSVVYPVTEGNVYVAGLVSEGALYTRVHFTNMSLPPGARVFVYSMSNPDEYHGPYEGRGASADGTFWTPRLTGDTVVIEYDTAPGTTSKGTPFTVSEVSHTFKEVAADNDQALFCNVEVPSDWANVAKSVGMLDFISGGFESICTGTLLNDAASDQIPYVLTANHCISSQTEAQSVIVFWNYNTGDNPPSGTPTTFGSNLLATGDSSDYTLLRLTGSLPGGLFFSGWDASFVNSSTPVRGIHHPNGSHKRTSTGNTNSICPSSGLSGPCQNFIGVTWDDGITEFGSSGSGIWTGTPSTAKLVGALSAG